MDVLLVQVNGADGPGRGKEAKRINAECTPSRFFGMSHTSHNCRNADDLEGRPRGSIGAVLK
ncbi:MAG TPA: hypothetical protein DCS11_09870 [Syntrophus sp. (in: bacteria)]|nr:hypothetical protein [Syntrophus sp. (in: bacteria)]